MKVNYNCLPCLLNQVIRVADITNADNREQLFTKVFTYLSNISFQETNPEICGATFEIITTHIGNDDPYKETRVFYNTLFLSMLDTFTLKIHNAANPFEEAVKYAIIGNIIDFNPIHNNSMADIMQFFDNADTLSLTVAHVDKLMADIMTCKRLLYLGDNCGEICLDLLFIREIRRLNPNLEILFGVRGKPIVNDSIEADAYFVGIDEYATIVSNGDGSMGTVLHRTSEEFRQVYDTADVVIAKGQANYESLSDERQKNIYFLLVTKCDVIANDVGVPIKSLVCIHKSYE